MTALKRLPAVLFAAALSAVTTSAFAAGRIVIDDTGVFPESLSSDAAGHVYIGSSTKGLVYRAMPGADKAVAFIPAGTSNMRNVFGVLADERSKTLWICSTDDDKTRNDTSLMAFSLPDGKFKARYPFPGGGMCNDIAIAPDGAAFVADTVRGRILKLAPGAASLTEFASGPDLKSVDGLVFTRDGKFYVNTYSTSRLLRVDANAGNVTITPLTTSRPLKNPDGMRLAPNGDILMAEGEGRLDRVVIQGDHAAITVLNEGLHVPVAVTVVGNTAWELESKFNYRREPLKGQDPGVFAAHAVPLQ
jgi:sugar lactone lactonase YvrE